MWIDVEARVCARAASEPREAAALTEAGLLPQFDAPWLREPRDQVEELRVQALETIAARCGPATSVPRVADAMAPSANPLARR